MDIKTGLEEKIVFPELVDTALIRELHTYGQVQNINSLNNTNNSSQHKGYGKKLMNIAEYIAYKFGYKRIGVIAGVGVREYYHKLGYKDEGIGNYQIKPINEIQETTLDDSNKLFVNILVNYEILYNKLNDKQIEQIYKYTKKIMKYKKIFFNYYLMVFMVLLIIIGHIYVRLF